MARRTKANLDCAILPPCTQKQSIKLPTVMKNLFTPFDLLCTAWNFFGSVGEFLCISSEEFTTVLVPQIVKLGGIICGAPHLDLIFEAACNEHFVIRVCH